MHVHLCFNRTNFGCGNCNHVNLDGMEAEMYSGGCNSGASDQRTVGMLCTSGNPDPSSGTYLGHGTGESSWPGEGSYYPGPNGCTAHDFYTYTTWVR